MSKMLSYMPTTLPRNAIPRRYAVWFSKRWNAKTTVAMTRSAVTRPVAKIVSASFARTLMSRRLVADLVAGASDGEDQLGPLRVGFELGAQPVDVRRHGVLVAVVAVAPDGVEQLAAREDMARVRCEMQQQIELERGEIERRAADPRLALRRPDLELAVLQHARLVRARRLRGAQEIGAAQERLDAREQLGERERLGEVVVGAELEAEDAVELGRLRSQHQDRRRAAARAQRLRHLETVEPRHHEVEDEQVGGPLALARERSHTVG